MTVERRVDMLSALYERRAPLPQWCWCCGCVFERTPVPGKASLCPRHRGQTGAPARLLVATPAAIDYRVSLCLAGADLDATHLRRPTAMPLFVRHTDGWHEAMERRRLIAPTTTRTE